MFVFDLEYEEHSEKRQETIYTISATFTCHQNKTGVYRTVFCSEAPNIF